jgi:hypothetical protein
MPFDRAVAPGQSQCRFHGMLIAQEAGCEAAEGGIEAAIITRRKLPNCKILLLSGRAATSGLLAKARERGHEFELLSLVSLCVWLIFWRELRTSY